MVNYFRSFCRDEDGAVTIDWVVLTAAIVALAIAAWTSIDTEATALVNSAGGAVGSSTTF